MEYQDISKQEVRLAFVIFDSYIIREYLIPEKLLLDKFY